MAAPLFVLLRQTLLIWRHESGTAVSSVFSTEKRWAEFLSVAGSAVRAPCSERLCSMPPR